MVEKRGVCKYVTVPERVPAAGVPLEVHKAWRGDL